MDPLKLLEAVKQMQSIFSDLCARLDELPEADQIPIVSALMEFDTNLHAHLPSHPCDNSVEAQVVKERNRLLAVMKALPIGLAIVDAQGGNIQANLGYDQVWGGSHAEANDVSDYAAYRAWWVESGQPVQPEEWASAQAVLKGQTVVGQFLQIERFDGTRAYVLNSAAPVFDEIGQITGSAIAIIDVTEQRRLQIQQLKNLTRMEVQHHLLENRENERQKIAQELHDGPIQDLSGLLFHIQFTKESCQDAEIQLELEQIGLRLKGAVQHIRGMINILRPPSLIRFGLAKAMLIYLQDFRERHPKIEIKTNLNDDADCLSEQVRLNLYRVLHEALENAARHSMAKKIYIHLLCSPQSVVMEIQDNGRGFDIPANFVEYSIHGQFGLVGMRELVEAIDGTFTIHAQPEKGTLIQVIVPLSRPGSN